MEDQKGVMGFPGGGGGGKDMFSSSDFSVIGYSSDSSMSAFTAQILFVTAPIIITA